VRRLGHVRQVRHALVAHAGKSSAVFPPSRLCSFRFLEHHNGREGDLIPKSNKKTKTKKTVGRLCPPRPPPAPPPPLSTETASLDSALPARGRRPGLRRRVRRLGQDLSGIPQLGPGRRRGGPGCRGGRGDGRGGGAGGEERRRERLEEDAEEELKERKEHSPKETYQQQQNTGKPERTIRTANVFFVEKTCDNLEERERKKKKKKPSPIFPPLN